MLVVGISWLLFWLLINVFNVVVDKAALITAIIFILAGLLLEGYPHFLRRP